MEFEWTEQVACAKLKTKIHKTWKGSLVMQKKRCSQLSYYKMQAFSLFQYFFVFSLFCKLLRLWKFCQVG